jgi:hypothetical protein
MLSDGCSVGVLVAVVLDCWWSLRDIAVDLNSTDSVGAVQSTVAPRSLLSPIVLQGNTSRGCGSIPATA